MSTPKSPCSIRVRFSWKSASWRRCNALDRAAVFVEAVGEGPVVVPVRDEKLVVLDADGVFLDAGAVAVAEDPQLALDGDDLVQRGDEEVAGADGGVADRQVVDQRVGRFPRLRIGRVQALLQIGEGPDLFHSRHIGPELLRHRPPEGLPADVHGDEAGGEKGAFPVAVDLLEDEAQDRGVDDGPGRLADAARPFAAEIVGVQETEEVGRGGKEPFPPFARFVLEDRAAVQRKLQAALEVGDMDRLALQIRLFEKGTVQVGNEAEFLRHGTPPLLRADRQDFEEQLFESVEILQGVRAEKGVAFVPAVPGDEPPLEELQEENPVDPGDAELQGGAEDPLVGVAFRSPAWWPRRREGSPGPSGR